MKEGKVIFKLGDHWNGIEIKAYEDELEIWVWNYYDVEGGLEEYASAIYSLDKEDAIKLAKRILEIFENGLSD